MLANETADKAIHPDFPNCPDAVWISARKAPITVFGLHNPCDGSVFHRFDPSVGKAISEAVDNLNHNPAGGRLTFMSDSPYIAVYVQYVKKEIHDNMAQNGSAGFDLYTIEENGTQCFAGSFLPKTDDAYSYCYSLNSRTNFGKMKQFIMYFPLYEKIADVFVGVSEKAEIAPCPSPYLPEEPIIFYGSSITQGASVSHPGNAYEGYISRHLRRDFYNFGLAANGKAEDVIVDYMASLPMSVFVSDYDHNAPDAGYLEKTHHRMYRAIRAAHPDIPYIMISKPDIDMHPAVDRVRREVIRRSYEQALAEGDGNVYFIDGETLFETEDRDACIADNVHPNDLGHYRMATVIEKVIAEALAKAKKK